MRRQFAAFGIACAVMLVCFAPGALCAAIVTVVPSFMSHQVATHHHAADHPAVQSPAPSTHH